jgi:tRNA A-37 threonylcarbamoyl transferase component Bud32
MMVTQTVRLARRLGSGGMGSVWVADHLALHTEVVVKFMSSELLDNPEAVGRFKREAAAASQVKSPHVVHTLDHGVTDKGAPYIVMEYLEGEDLARRIESRGALPPQDVLSIVVQLARALVRAHERGIVHRDIKPNNIFLCDAGGGDVFVKLLDFGIAKARDLPLLSNTTRTGSVVGSPFYMSPEQVVGSKTVNHTSDLWSLGVVTFEALTGKKPFFGETLGSIALKIHNDPMPVPSQANPALSPAIDAWFERACARDLTIRFASAKEMADALASAIAGSPPSGAVLANTVPSVPPTPRHPLADSVAGVESRVTRRAIALRDPKIAVAAAGVLLGIGLATTLVWMRGRASEVDVSAAPPRAESPASPVVEVDAGAQAVAASPLLAPAILSSTPAASVAPVAAPRAGRISTGRAAGGRGRPAPGGVKSEVLDPVVAPPVPPPEPAPSPSKPSPGKSDDIY